VIDNKEPLSLVKLAGRSQETIIDEMVSDIKAAIYKHADKIPIALAIGALRIVELEIFEECD